MEKMPFNEHVHETPAARPVDDSGLWPEAPEWQRQVPILTGERVTLRELRTSDAPALLAMLSTEEVARFISPPPTTVEGFEKFILWAQRQRQAGEYVCFGVVPHGLSVAIGLFQIKRLERDFATAEWGFALGSAFWGTGLFVEGGELTVGFAFGTLGVERLEARCCVANGRGNGALRKIGAVQEGVLRRAFLRNGSHLDQVIWSILSIDWRQTKAIWGPRIKMH